MIILNNIQMKKKGLNIENIAHFEIKIHIILNSINLVLCQKYLLFFYVKKE